MPNLLREVDLTVQPTTQHDFSAERTIVRRALETIAAIAQSRFEERLAVMTYPYDQHDLFGKNKEDKGLCIFKVATEQFQMDEPPFYHVGPYGETVLAVVMDTLASTGKISIAVHDERLVVAARTYLGAAVETMGMSDVLFAKNFQVPQG
jgi:hypothetical protein